MSLDNSLVVIQSKNKKYLTVLTSGEEFIINDGKISYDDIKTLPVQVQSSTGDYFNIYTPTYKEFVLLMRRGPQIIYQKDVGSIIIPQLDYRLWKHYHATHFPHHLTYTTMY